MIRNLIQSYSRKSVIGALAGLKHGQLTIVSKDQGKDSDALVFGPESTHNHASLVVLNPNAWTRICQAFDLV